MRVDRPEGLEVSADPLQKHGARGALGHFHPVVYANQAHAFLRQGVELLEVLVDRMPAPAVRENDHCGGVLEDGGIARPTTLVDRGFDREARFFDQGVGEEVHALSPIMGA